VLRTATATAVTLPSPFAIPSDPFCQSGDLPLPTDMLSFGTNTFGRAQSDAVSGRALLPQITRLSALFAAHETAVSNSLASARTSTVEPEVDVFGEVRTPPETVRVSRRTSRAERRLSKETATQVGPLPMVTSPPPLTPLPALPVQVGDSMGSQEASIGTTATAEKISPSFSTKGKLPLETGATVTSHRRADSDLSQASAVSSAGSARGTYFDAYRPMTASSSPWPSAAAPMTPDSLASANHLSSPLGDLSPGPLSSSARLLPNSKPRPLSQDVRRPVRGTRRAPARPETADDPCLILKETSYRPSGSTP
jgi:hypothetical protein